MQFPLGSRNSAKEPMPLGIGRGGTSIGKLSTNAIFGFGVY